MNDPDTGRQIISRVYQGHALYSGPYRENFPELFLEPAPGYMIRGGFGRSLIEKFPMPKSSHAQEGIFICKGPGIKPHRYEQYITIQDLAPTILYLLGLPIPKDMDGKVHVDIMNSSERKDCRYAEEEASVYESSSISREEEKSLMAKLKALGYMD